jgi:hydroxymethylpyrimidine/phosphomethylpyrimidine kinase
MTPSRPIALTIAGSDPSGGAGIQADLKTFTVFGAYGASVVTALTAQNTLGVTGVHKVPAEFIAAQFDAVTSDLNIAATKTGMLGDEQTVRTVARLLAGAKLKPLVVDPVMVATSGDVLLAPDAIAAVRSLMLPLATLITPNLPEAAKLLDQPIATTPAGAQRQAEALLEFGCGAVLLKGGHGEGAESVDFLVSGAGTIRLAMPRIATRNTHGTGCTLAAAITASLAMGLTLEDAVRKGKNFVWSALQAGANMRVGGGTGPVDHLFEILPHCGIK